MAMDIAGIVNSFDIQPEVINEVDVFTQQAYVNLFPLISRTPRRSVTTPDFDIRYTKGYRPKQFVFSNNLAAGDAYSLLTLTPQTPTPGVQVGDSTSLMAGDVLSITTAGVEERLEVIATNATEVAALPKLPTGQSIPAAGNLLVRRAAEGTASAAHTPADGMVLLIANSRTGGEVFQSAYRPTPINFLQHCQTFMFPVQTSGSVQTTAVVGIPNVFGQDKANKLTSLMREMERSSWYGLGEATSSTNSRPKQIGLRAQIGPTTASSPGNYLPASLVDDLFKPIWDLDGIPDFAFASSDVIAGIDGWGGKLLRLEMGSNEFGVKITGYQTSLADGVTIIPASSLRQGTIVAGQSNSLFWRVKRAEFWNQHGVRGDAIEGDWIAEGAIEAQDHDRFRWIEGITNFGVPA